MASGRYPDPAPSGGSPTFDDLVVTDDATIGDRLNIIGVLTTADIAGTSLVANPTVAAFPGDATVNGGAAVMIGFVSDEIDFMTPGPVPFGGTWGALPGYQFAPQSIRLYMTNIAATTFATSGAVEIGNNVATDNIAPSNAVPSAANMNAELAADGPGGAYNNAPIAASGVLKLPDLTTPPTVNVITSPTGTAITQCRGRIIAFGVLTTLLPVV